jgi:hypothetical protein
MSKETRRDIVLIVIFSLVSAIGMISVFLGYRFLAWIAIVISDFYLFAVLPLAALRAEDDGFLDRQPWVTRFFPRKPAGISSRYPAFSGNCFWFCRSICWSGSLSIRQDATGCSLRQLLYLGIHRLLAIAWLWSACSDRSARQWSSFAGCTFSHPHLAHFHFQKSMKPGRFRFDCIPKLTSANSKNSRQPKANC